MKSRIKSFALSFVAIPLLVLADACGDVVIGSGAPPAPAVSGFPVVESVTETAFPSAATAHLCNLPATVDAADLLGILFSTHAGTTATPAGWTELYDTGIGMSSQNAAAFVISAVGDEDGGTVDLVTSVSASGASCQVYRITDWSGTIGDVEAATFAISGTNQVDIPALDPTGDADNTLWIAVDHSSDDDIATTTIPNAYGNLVDTAVGAGTNLSARVASATRELNATSEDPGIWTLASNEAQLGVLIAVRHDASGEPPPPSNATPVWNATPNPTFTTSQPGVYSLANSANTADATEDASDTDGDALTFANEAGCSLPTGISIDNVNDEIDYNGTGLAGDTTGCVFSASDGTASANSAAFTIQIADSSAFYFDQDGGSDANDCLTPGTACQTISKANVIEFGPGVSVLFECGDTFGDDLTLDITDSGESGSPITIGQYGTCTGSNDPVIRQSQANGDWITYDSIDFNGDQFPDRVIRIRGDNVVVQNSEVHNGTGDGIDIRGGACATTCTIQNTEIHHLLAGTFGSKDDAHGIGIRAGTGNTVNVTVSNVNIHEVSGDSIQADPDWQSTTGWTINLTVSDSELWTQPLAANFNAGWSAGNIPGEGGLDTKGDTASTQSLTITMNNIVAHGWTDIAEISNRSAFNIKHSVDFTFDRGTVYDTEHCFRLRGDTGTGNPVIEIMNAVVYDCVNAMRVEDALDNPKIYNNTFGSGITTFYQEITGGIDAGADLRNNLFFGTVPANDFTDATNVTFDTDDIANEPDNDYEPCTAATQIVDQGDTIAAVTQDRNAISRAAPYNIGAFETSTATANCMGPPPPGGEHVYYDTLAARSDVNIAVAFRSQEDVEAHWRPNNHDDVSYDPVEDALQTRWPTAGGGSNIDDLRVVIDPPLSSGKVFVTWEAKWSVEWASDGGGDRMNGIRQFKDYQYAKSGGFMLEIRKIHHKTAPNDIEIPAGESGGIDIRTYFGGGGGAGQPDKRLKGTLADFVLGNEVWIRYFLFVEYGGNGKITLWVTQPGDAPTKIYDQATGDSSGDPGEFASFWFEHNSSQTYSGPTSHVWNRNFVVLDGVADLAAAQALVTEGTLE